MTLDNAKVNEEVPIAKREKIPVSPRRNLEANCYTLGGKKEKKETVSTVSSVFLVM